jgi:hypothetical protein
MKRSALIDFSCCFGCDSLMRAFSSTKTLIKISLAYLLFHDSSAADAANLCIKTSNMKKSSFHLILLSFGCANDMAIFHNTVAKSRLCQSILFTG